MKGLIFLTLLFSFSLQSEFSRYLQPQDQPTCGDFESAPCYKCIDTPKAKYCKYTKAFKRYLCCKENDSDGMCNSKDDDVTCSDKYQGLLKYQVCYRDSLKCGSEQVFIVNVNMQTTTTEFFADPSICLYRLKTYEDNDRVNINVTFTKVVKAEAFLVYKKDGDTVYTEKQIELSDRENYTFSIQRLQLDSSDKTIYVIAKSTSADKGQSQVTFETVRQDMPIVIPDNSVLAHISMWVLVSCLALTFIIKLVEQYNRWMETKEFLDDQNEKFRNRIGIDFKLDRERLQEMAMKAKGEYSNDCWKNRSLLFQQITTVKRESPKGASRSMQQTPGEETNSQFR